MDCLSGLPKYILFSFNVLLVVFGTILIAVGVVSSSTSTIAQGVIMFIIAFFGCWGVIKKTSWMLTTYAIILIVLCIIQVLLGALTLVLLADDSSMTKTARDEVEKFFQNYVNDQNNTDKKKAVDDMQQKLKCCGVNNSDYWTTAIGKIPDSCFEDNDRSSTQYTEGCLSNFKSSMSSQVKTTGGVLIGFSVFELVVAMFAFKLKNRLQEQDE